jgi:hypothetical protein
MCGLGEGEGQRIALQTVSTAGSIVAGTAPAWTQAAWAVPVIGGAVAGVALAITAWFSRKGPKQKKATTAIANEVQGYLDQNRAAYFSGPRTVSSQTQALANFDALWQGLEQGCGDPDMGDPGERCISERDRGGRYDWFPYYRDDIANDPEVRPDATALEEAASVAGSLVGGSNNLLLVGALALGVMALTMGGKGGRS